MIEDELNLGGGRNPEKRILGLQKKNIYQTGEVTHSSTVEDDM